MEILEIVAGPLPARLLGQYFAVVAAFRRRRMAGRSSKKSRERWRSIFNEPS